RIGEMFRVRKDEFRSEDACVRSLQGMTRLCRLGSMMITFMSSTAETRHGLFQAVSERARGTHCMNQVKMALSVFSSVLNAILKRDIHGIKHFKYIEEPKNPMQLTLSLTL